MTRQEKALHLHAITMDYEYLKKWLQNRERMLHVAVLQSHIFDLNNEISILKERMKHYQNVINTLTKDLESLECNKQSA